MKLLQVTALLLGVVASAHARTAFRQGVRVQARAAATADAKADAQADAKTSVEQQSLRGKAPGGLNIGDSANIDPQAVDQGQASMPSKGSLDAVKDMTKTGMSVKDTAAMLDSGANNNEGDKDPAGVNLGSGGGAASKYDGPKGNVADTVALLTAAPTTGACDDITATLNGAAYTCQKIFQDDRIWLMKANDVATRPQLMVAKNIDGVTQSFIKTPSPIKTNFKGTRLDDLEAMLTYHTAAGTRSPRVANLVGVNDKCDATAAAPPPNYSITIAGVTDSACNMAMGFIPGGGTDAMCSAGRPMTAADMYGIFQDLLEAYVFVTKEAPDKFTPTDMHWDNYKLVEAADLAAIDKKGYTPGRVNAYIYDVQLAEGPVSQPFEGSTVNNVLTVKSGFCDLLTTGSSQKASGETAAQYIVNNPPTHGATEQQPAPFFTYADDQAEAAAQQISDFMCGRTWDSTAGTPKANANLVCTRPTHNSMADCLNAWNQLPKAVLLPPDQAQIPAGGAQLGWAASYAAKIAEIKQIADDKAAAAAAVEATAATMDKGMKVTHSNGATGTIARKFMGKFAVDWDGPAPPGGGNPKNPFYPGSVLTAA